MLLTRLTEDVAKAYRPPPVAAAFSVKVQPTSDAEALVLAAMPPPKPVDEFAAKMELTKEVLPLRRYMPPPVAAEFPLNMQPDNVD